MAGIVPRRRPSNLGVSQISGQPAIGRPRRCRPPDRRHVRGRLDGGRGLCDHPRMPIDVGPIAYA